MSISEKSIKSILIDYFLLRKDPINLFEFAYLFGSHAKNEQNNTSDIDIAVFLSKHLNSKKQFDTKLELLSDLCKLLKTDKIDLVVLNEAPLSLCFNIIRDGIILYEKNEIERSRFETKIMKLFFDRQYYYERHNNIAINLIAHEGIL